MKESLSDTLKTFKTKWKRFKFKGEGHVLGDGKDEERQEGASAAESQGAAAPRPPPAGSDAGRQSHATNAARAEVPVGRKTSAQDAEREKVLQAALDRQKPKKKPTAAKRTLRDLDMDDDNVNPILPPPHGSTAAASVSEAWVEDAQLNLGLLMSQEAGQESASLMKRILLNISDNPSEPKYRRLRLDNQKIAKAIGQVQGAVGFLKACGFAEMVEEGSSVLVFEGNSKLGELREGLKRIEGLFPTPQNTDAVSASTVGGSKSSESTAEVAGGRDTQLLLMKPTEAEVPSWFFDKMGSEIKEEYMLAKRKLEQSKILMTSAWREALAQKGKKHYTTAVIRVRMPEGVLLQGSFHGREPVIRIHEWVAECLRDGSREFQLYSPMRHPLATEGPISQNDLMPAALLSFRWVDEQLTAEPSVNDATLALAKIDWG